MPPHVSVIVPARNEERHIEACVRSIRSQELDAGLEVIVADGRSSDRTAELAARAGATVVDNPQRVIPAALNRGLAAARGDIVLRFDAHSEMPAGYVAACLRALAQAEDIGTVGGWREVGASGPWGRALAAALGSPLGIGYPMRWRRPAPGMPRVDVDTVHFGCYRKEVLVRLGGWREDILTNEDFELDYRLRRAGYRVVFDPAVWSIYRPRESFAAIVRQYWRYGRWKAEVLAAAPASVRPRQLAPPLLVVTASLTPTRGRPRLWARAALVAYAILLASAAARSASGWRLGALLAGIHLSWAGGLLTRLPLASVDRLLTRAGARSDFRRSAPPRRAGPPA
jgi:succinoglycan biosynthesis protein ExoA